MIVSEFHLTPYRSNEQYCIINSEYYRIENFSFALSASHFLIRIEDILN